MNNACLTKFFLSFLSLTVLGIIPIPETSGYSVNSSYAPNNFGRTRRQVKQCEGSDQFQCRSGQCISLDDKCNGQTDCEDKSDETKETCLNTYCPRYTFVCDYGGCVPGFARCNGSRDCADNSDEEGCLQGNVTTGGCKLPDHPENGLWVIQGDAVGKPGLTVGVNTLLIYSCDKGYKRSTENGLAACLSDGWSGPQPRCLQLCPALYNTATSRVQCFDKDNNEIKCNGASDGSSAKFECASYHESADRQTSIRYCSSGSWNLPPPQCIPGRNVTTTTQKIPDTVSTPPPNGGCKLPNYPENGQWVIHGRTDGNPGQTVEENTILSYSCQKGYKLSSENRLAACLSDGWSGPQPSCLKICAPLYSTSITKVQCFDKDKTEIKCDEATDESSAKFECAAYYEPLDRQITIRYCWSGSWNLPPPQCVPVCGEKRLSAEPLIMNGNTVDRGDYPWVTAVFRKTGEGFINSCGGTMLTQRVIVTAAHCVADEYGRAVDKSEVKVGVGKYYNKYRDERDTLAQYSDVQLVLVHPKYKGDSQRYASDIAFLVTKDTLLLSKVVQSVCFRDLPDIHLTVRSEGVITGWGFTEAGGGPSEELTDESVPFKDDATCNAELPPDWADKYNAYDKLCAGHYNKSIAVCKGNSGGGLFFKNPKDGRFYVHGLVSVVGRKVNNGGCDVQVNTLFTKVAAHYDMLEQIVSQYTKLI